MSLVIPFLIKNAVVTGANKGIGFEICKQLASNGIEAVLTAVEEKGGLVAVQKLKDSGLSDRVVFQQLDVTDEASVASLADFIKTQFGKLDILVNNAGVSGAKMKEHINGDVLKAMGIQEKERANVDWREISVETHELAEECIDVNYYGPKRMVEAHAPLLQLSDSPTIVNVSSSIGQLQNIPNGWAKEVLADEENLTEERVEEVVGEFLKDFKEGSLEVKNWPTFASAYTVSKAALNAYTRVIARKYPSFCINSVCPGFVKTDINLNTGILSVEEGAESPVRLALLPNGGPSGCFFSRKEEVPF